MSDGALYMTVSATWEADVEWNDDAIWNDSAFIVGLLPSSATPQEEALDGATGRIGAVPLPLRSIWRPEDCPTDLLPWLAWTLSVDDWDNDWTEETKRTVIAASVDVHRHKGTVAAVKRALASAGYGDATLIERYGRRQYDGSVSYDGSETHYSGDHWAEYRVVMARPITIAQGEMVRRILASVAPLRCHLRLLDFTQAKSLYNGAIRYDGAYSYGAT